jgi:plasmid stabilization system protein ParE
MSCGLIVRAEAEADIAEAAKWYEEREKGLGTEFIAEINQAIERIGARPLTYLRLRSNPEVRRILLRRFPYRVFYIVRRDAILVFAVLHTARHERHWRQRARGEN